MSRDFYEEIEPLVYDKYWYQTSPGPGQYTHEYEWSKSYGDFTRATGWRGDLTASNFVRPTNYNGSRFYYEPARGYGRDSTDSLRIIDGEYIWGRGAHRDQVHHGMPSDFYEAGYVPEHLYRVARGKALLALVDSSVDFGQLLGEAPENMRMMADATVRVLLALRAARRLDGRGIARALGVRQVKTAHKSAVNLWFEYKFGWSPLISDIYNAGEAVRTQLNRPEFTRITRSAAEEHQITDPARYKAEKVTKGVKVGVAYTIGNEALAKLNSLGLINPASIAWELLPLSFVLDWFIPVGDFLKQMSAPIGLDFAGGYVTRYGYGNLTYTPIEPGWQDEVLPGSIESFQFVRTELTDWPRPSIVVDFGISSNQLATIFGLLAQRL